MLESPDAVLVYIPLMKHLGMDWKDIKNTPHHELRGLLIAYKEHEMFHSMDGYTDKQVGDMAKENPQIRSQYAQYLETRRKYEEKLGVSKKVTFKGL